MKLFYATYGDFIKFDEKPNEDFYLFSKKFPIFAVADGVTQSHFKNGKYAFPNGAKESAEIFCKSAVKFLEKNLDLEKAFNFANGKIKELNIKYGIDEKLNYVEYDWLDTVGVVGYILKNKLFYGYTGDCGLIIFDKNNKKKFQTKDMVAPALKKFKGMYKDWENLSKEKRALIIHRDFRNNPNKKGYGSFSGEEGVKNYYKFGNIKLNKNDLVIFYTDGFFELLKDKGFVKILREGDKKKLNSVVLQKAEENDQKFGADRTFISVKFEA
ncbi:MAG: hypothetical protein A2528_00385 [Candidatus Staskawiczbacteria bacterium RIFOXYD2_FULL_37_9]|uniref:PPM-type phosphatase domain-containing protein n=1 Tax=Candidatus Staskawiczbacteria bacterium RIFOXYB1_FULL_37_44 TaxID=1802223 RepID=A0A1G2IW78_9BACT|nr:MAG: hypothetical protein A2358_01080 [Candidatus Staskawiczbacteria bacterium RIFOXYB1_FULL_37_44]OGZ84755.1 MAG: hypothetical protein A2416_01090 [Candidatus Staskawiczbacteria bacterium RIFOXYC1_FULL_37_52]OGZ89073.1 MAG: hypothetical protein A2444_00785 [Candidatus Staskawiczbacteria bacterium RIFOXYC2_FULL_37_19]OGZ90368.1 MAG: hypothetical protein A2581_01050 [Candidatus Staskawiczbacteria bacterium RIFOXYD1_FULL_37_110]OGZ92775.1 MAG: hypothetical protein A2528_00385 [Candidatus Stask